MADTRELKHNIKRAEERLDSLEAQVSKDDLLQRLVRESPYHPLLLGMWSGMASGVLFGLTALLTLILPMTSPEMARMVATFDLIPMIPLPLILGVLALASLGLVGVTRHLAIARGKDSPMMTGEFRTQQRLEEDLQKAKKDSALWDRMRNG